MATERMVRITPTAHQTMAATIRALRVTREIKAPTTTAARAMAAVMNTGLTAAQIRTEVFAVKVIQRRVSQQTRLFFVEASVPLQNRANGEDRPSCTKPFHIIYFCNDRNY
jgi:hypothetical protein